MAIRIPPKLVGLIVATLVVVPAQAEEPGRLSVSLGYLGQTLTHPGALASLQCRLLSVGQAHQLFVRASLGGYVHPRNHVGLLATVEVGTRATAAWGLFGELGVFAGYQHTFLASTVYAIDAGRVVTIAGDGGSGSFIPGVSLGAGWDFGRNTDLPTAVTLRPMLWWQMGEGAPAVMRFGAFFGATYTF